MDDWRETLALLRAQAVVQHMALRALLHSHPDPGAVLAAWLRIRADAVNAAYLLPSDERTSAWLSEQVHAFAEDWTAELVDAATARDPQGAQPDSNGDVGPAGAPAPPDGSGTISPAPRR